MRDAYLLLVAAVALVPVSSIQMNVHERQDSGHPVIDLVMDQQLDQQLFTNDKDLHQRPRRHLGHQPKRNATAQIYVVNLWNRKDRWQCAANQLAAGNAPYPYDRFEAVSAKNVYQKCPHLARHAIGGGKPAHGILCSNYKIWEKELNGTSDFVIIFEDDIAMGMHMWERVTELLNGNCSDAFDYLAVDTFGGAGKSRHVISGKSEFCANASNGLGLHLIRGSGAQMQIFRRSALRQFMNLAEGLPSVPLDAMNKYDFNEAHHIRGGMFQARIAAQYKSRKEQGVRPSRADSSKICASSIGKVDIRGR